MPDIHAYCAELNARSTRHDTEWYVAHGEVKIRFTAASREDGYRRQEQREAADSDYNRELIRQGLM